MTGSGRSTSCIAAFGRRSMKGDLFVLTVLRNGSRSLLLPAKGGDLSPNRTRQQLPHETPPISTKAGPNAPTGEFLCWWACLSSYVCRTVYSVCLARGIKGTGLRSRASAALL